MRRILIRSKKHGNKFAIVDDEDYDLVSKFKWRIKDREKYLYAMVEVTINGHSKKYIMHRIILGAKKGELVDHKNHNGLDNRRNNIRICTYNQNAMNRVLPEHNTTGYKGIWYEKKNRTFRAAIKSNGQKFHLGSFSTKKQAAIAYNDAAKKYHGEFAKLNKL